MNGQSTAVGGPSPDAGYGIRCHWDFRGWEHNYLYTLFNSNQRTFPGRCGNVAVSPDGKRIVSASEDKTVKVWDGTLKAP